MDFLKGLCILAVIVIHYIWTWEQRLNFLFPFWIDMAIPLFMLISGYVYSLSLLRNGIGNFTAYYNFENLISKLLRFFIPFLIIFIVSILFDINKLGIAFDFRYYEARFWEGGINGPGAYYVPVMTQFVFIFPIIYFVVKKFEFKGFLICLLLNFFYEYLHIMYQLNEPTYSFLMFRYISLIAFGTLIALYPDVKIDFSLLFIPMILGILFIINTTYRGLSSYYMKDWTRTSWLATFYIIPFFYYLVKFKFVLKCSIIEHLGKASFNIFLIQLFYYTYISDFMYSCIVNNILRLIVNILFCCVIGIFFYFIEQPITKILINKLRGAVVK